LFAKALLNNKWFTRHVVLDRWFLRTHRFDRMLRREGVFA
jgi:hypothetical protein